jgi:hypothetical protein
VGPSRLGRVKCALTPSLVLPSIALPLTSIVYFNLPQGRGGIVAIVASLLPIGT